jgi:HEAT repeat protein
MATRSTCSRRTVFLLLLVSAISCQEPLPDDLPSLTSRMNSNSETTAVAAANKVARVYGKEGLLHVLSNGGPTARTMAAGSLARFPGEDVQSALLKAVASNDEGSVRVRALMALERIGTANSLAVIERASDDPDSSVAEVASRTAKAIRRRSAAR